MAVADAESVRQTAREVLSRPEFDTEETWWDRLAAALEDPLGFVGEMVARVLARLVGEGSGTVVAWVVVALVAAVLLFVIIRVTRNLGRDTYAAIAYETEVEEAAFDELWAKAEELAKNGDYRLAIRYQYAALLAELDADGLVDRRRGKTTGEYVLELSRRAPGAAPVFSQLTSLFEWVWYGRGRPQREDFERFAALAAHARSSVAA